MRERARAVPFGVPLEGRRAARRGAPLAHQDHARVLPGDGEGAARGASLRTSRDHRGPNRARPARVSRLGGSGNEVKRSLLLVLFVVCAPALAQLKLGQPVLLEPEKAFRFSAHALSDAAIEVRFDIADGYYLYRERMRFVAEGARLGKPEFPQGIRHKDEFFGEMQIYRKEVRVRVPVDGAGPFDLTVSSQGCA